MITPIFKNKINNNQLPTGNAKANLSNLGKTQAQPDKFQSQIHFSGAIVNNKSRGLLSRIFGSAIREATIDGGILRTKFNRAGVRINETYAHPSGYRAKFFFEPDGKTVAGIKKYMHFFSLKESYIFNKGKQYKATRYNNIHNFEEFRFFGRDNKQCIYTKTINNNKPKEIILALPKALPPGTIPNVRMLMPIESADVLNYKVKVKDLDDFITKVDQMIDEKVQEGSVRSAGDSYIIEGPRYKKYKEDLESLYFQNWSVGQLKERGFNVELPKDKENNPEDILDVYLFTSKEFAKAYNNNIVNDYKLSAQAYNRANKSSQKFSDLVGGADADANYKYTADILFSSEYAKVYQQKFISFLDNFHIRTLNYTPKA